MEQAKAKALEIALFEKDKERFSSLMAGTNFSEARYLSLHLDDYLPQKTELEQINGILKIVEKYRPQTALIHPLPMPETFFEALASGFPLAIENLDPDKPPIGHELEKLRQRIEKYRLGFVLDLQHAYEHDPALVYAGDLFETFRGQLRHLHVSGENPKSRHALLHQAKNAGKIIDFLGAVLSEKNVPIILEGEYQCPEELQKEIEFVTGELS